MGGGGDFYNHGLIDYIQLVCVLWFHTGVKRMNPFVSHNIGQRTIFWIGTTWNATGLGLPFNCYKDIFCSMVLIRRIITTTTGRNVNIYAGEMLASSYNSRNCYFSLMWARLAPGQCLIFQIYGVKSRFIISHEFLANWNNHSQLL